jgi:acyl carrier protein
MKISREDFESILKGNVSNINIDKLDSSRRMVDMGLDSLGFATLLFAIEDKLGIQIDERQLEGLNTSSTLGDMVSIFERLGYQIEI